MSILGDLWEWCTTIKEEGEDIDKEFKRRREELRRLIRVVEMCGESMLKEEKIKEEKIKEEKVSLEDRLKELGV
jgi:hypothetical protein